MTTWNGEFIATLKTGEEYCFRYGDTVSGPPTPKMPPNRLSVPFTHLVANQPGKITSGWRSVETRKRFVLNGWNNEHKMPVYREV